MESNDAGGDAYAIVLADLFAKRDQINAAIAALEGLRGGKTTAGVDTGRAEIPLADPGIDAGAFLGMSIAEAAKKLLNAKRRTMNNQDIARELKAGGLALTSADPTNVIGSVLTRRFKDVGDIVRVDRGTWGLASWYPNRTFKPQAKAAKAAQAASGSSDQQPPPFQERTSDPE